MKRVNLGCGQFYKEGYVNVDFDPKAKVDIKHNLDLFPYPFEDNSVDELTADHVLEHLTNPFATMEEIHRILKPGGKLIIRVPHSSRGFTHADHKRGFDITFPFYFDPTFLGGYSGIHYKLQKMKLSWSAQPYLKKQMFSAPLFYSLMTVGAIIDFFANLSPAFCSRIWCYWVGGFEQIEYIFNKPNE